MNGYVGVLDLDDINETYVKKRNVDGPFRTEKAHEDYTLNKEDKDRILYGLDADNQMRPSKCPPLSEETRIEELEIEDEDNILRLR